MADVCAIFVTYHPDAGFEETVRMVGAEVGSMIIVDNHSVAELPMLRDIAQRYGAVLIENEDNLGIGTALNRGIARVEASEFVLLFDQDSSIVPGFVEHLVAAYRNAGPESKVYLVASSIVDKRTGHTYPPQRRYGGLALLAQTSGSLMPMKVFRDDGLFREDLFIDFVDYEHCLRMATRGWHLLYCPEAKLLHAPGLVEKIVVGGKEITTWNYSPLRQYYLTRNRLWGLGAYGLRFPHWGAMTLYGLLKEMLLVLRYEKDRRRKAKAWWLGIKHAFRSHLGKLSPGSLG